MNYSAFATREEALSREFTTISEELSKRHRTLGLADHRRISEERYPWSKTIGGGSPVLYASRLWEYPFAVHAAELSPGMQVCDLGCGMTPFTPYLKEQCQCDVIGVDPDLFDAGEKYLTHGVNQTFTHATGLDIRQGGFESIPVEDSTQDRVFCISVMEHVQDAAIRRKGMHEIARILKPGGRAILTVDVSVSFDLVRPLDLVWDSGLDLLQPIDLRWPAKRFGQLGLDGPSIDVFGMTLHKYDRSIELRYSDGPAIEEGVPSYRIPLLQRAPSLARPTHVERLKSRVVRTIKNRL